jgi:hypothetical protein
MQSGPLHPNSYPESESSMLSIQKIQLNICDAYLAWVRELYPNEEDGADRLILVLRIYRWHLHRYAIHATPKALTLNQLQMFKTCIRTAELLIADIHENEPEMMSGWYMGCLTDNQAQRLANLMWEICLELTKEIQANEELYPDLKPAFDRERATYRRMKFEAEQAMSLD